MEGLSDPPLPLDDAQPRDCWQGVSDEFGYLLDAPGGRVVGFKVQSFSNFDLDADEVAEIWEAPLFDAPQLGLTNASAGEVATAARAYFGGESSLNRHAFSAAASEKGEEALDTWRICLQAGDMMAHFALGYTHYDLGNFQEAGVLREAGDSDARRRLADRRLHQPRRPNRLEQLANDVLDRCIEWPRSPTEQVSVDVSRAYEPA